jgi:hypothetical protein
MSQVAYHILAYSAAMENTQRMYITHTITDPIEAENLAEELARTLNNQTAGNTNDWQPQLESYIVA